MVIWVICFWVLVTGHRQVSARPLARKAPSQIEKKLVNIEHRTLNVEHRIMYSVSLKKDGATRGASACAARTNLPLEIRFSLAYRRQRFLDHAFSVIFLL